MFNTRVHGLIMCPTSKFIKRKKTIHVPATTAATNLTFQAMIDPFTFYIDGNPSRNCANGDIH